MTQGTLPLTAARTTARRDICANRHRGSATSIAANPSDEHKHGSREDIVRWLRSRDGQGGTCQEYCDARGSLKMNAISPRFTELKESGTIYTPSFPSHTRNRGKVHFLSA